MAVNHACDRLTQVMWVSSRAPAVVVSGLIWCGFAAQLGTWVPGPEWLVMAGLVAGLLAGLGVVQAGTRVPSAVEEQTLAETRRMLGVSGVDPGCLVVSRWSRGDAAAWARGRREVVLSPALLVGLSRRRIGDRDAAVLIARVVGWQRAHPGRGSALDRLWLLPWRMLSSVVN